MTVVETELETTFDRAKALFDQEKSYEEITAELGITLQYAREIKSASRRGFSSVTHLNNHRAKQKGFKNVQRQRMALHGFQRPIDLLSQQAQKRGYASWRIYISIRNILNEDDEIPIHTISPDELEELAETQSLSALVEHRDEGYDKERLQQVY